MVEGKKRKEFAPGISDPERFEPLPSVKNPQQWKSVIHKHDAFRAGTHFDLRLLEPKTDNLHSWALRKLPKPGEKALAVLQPTHSAEYMTFKGVIPKGYGAGPVGIHSKKSVTVLKSDPKKISFKRGRELYTLVKTKGMGKKDWLLLNRTKTAAAGAGASNDIVAMLFTNLLRGTKLDTAVREMRHVGRGKRIQRG